jgi:phosphoribosylformylglycinamidine cyclo-ligase
MLRTFNCGIGMVVVVEATQSNEAIHALQAAGEAAIDIGEITMQKAGGPRVTYSGELAL